MATLMIKCVCVCVCVCQVFVHLSTLERSVMWSRSLLNTRCKICRRKGDSDAMLLCDGCDRGHHMHCLRPRLKVRTRARTHTLCLCL